MECAKCGAFSDQVRLFDFISKEGIVHLCLHCSQIEKLPMIKRPTTTQLKDAEREGSARFTRSNDMGVVRSLRGSVNPTDMTLRDIVDKRYEEKVKQNFKPRKDLIDNFHWALMRARKKKHLTREQLAKEIGESHTAIKMAESGTLPEDDYKLVNKLESFLGVQIVKRAAPERAVSVEPPSMEALRNEELDFDPVSTKELTIGDLKRLQQEGKTVPSKVIYREEIELSDGENLEQEEPEPSSEDVSARSAKKELTQQEIDDLIFGRK